VSAQLEELKAQLWHRRLDVRADALAQIGALAGADATPLYLELLFDPRFRQKLEVMRVVAAAADGRAIDGVVRYTHANLQKLRARRRNALRRRAADETLALIATYLARFAHQHPDVRPVIREVAAISPHAAHEILPKIA
jgi:hypothetical protein